MIRAQWFDEKVLQINQLDCAVVPFRTTCGHGDGALLKNGNAVAENAGSLRKVLMLSCCPIFSKGRRQSIRKSGTVVSIL